MARMSDSEKTIWHWRARAEAADERASQLERDLQVAQSMDMTATANQWEAACKQARREADKLARDNEWLAQQRAQARREADQLRAALEQITDSGPRPRTIRSDLAYVIHLQNVARAALAGVQAKERP